MKPVSFILLSCILIFCLSSCQYYTVLTPSITYAPDSSSLSATFSNTAYRPNDRGGGALYKFTTEIPARFGLGGTTTHKFKLHVEKQSKYRATMEFSVGEKMWKVVFERGTPVYADTIVQFTEPVTPNHNVPCRVFLAGNAEAIELQSWDAEIH